MICGRQDLLTPPKFHRELADEIPGAHLVTIAHGAHLVMVESAETFNRTVLQFLGEGAGSRFLSVRTRRRGSVPAKQRLAQPAPRAARRRSKGARAPTSTRLS